MFYRSRSCSQAPGLEGFRLQRVTYAANPGAWRPAHSGAVDIGACRVASEAAGPQAAQGPASVFLAVPARRSRAGPRSRDAGECVVPAGQMV